MNNLRRITLKSDKDLPEPKIYYFHQWILDQINMRNINAIVEDSKGEVGLVSFRDIVFVNA